MALANRGYRLLAVLVSLLMLAPAFTVAQEAVVPLVVRYLPELPVWLGKASTVAQLTLVPSVVKYLPALPV